VKVSLETFEVLRRGIEMARDCGGAFDFTVAPLLARWSMLPPHLRRRRPGNWQDVLLLMQQQVRFAKPLAIDLGGIAKGYGVDRAAMALEARGIAKWLDELVWREFYAAILETHPRVLRSAFRPEYDTLRWNRDERGFRAWCEGRTGYPFVDAAMRQLRATGWMHNRPRMLVASFLAKDLLIDWRRGERFFMQRLVDGDPASNNGGWQWAASTGTDAQPWFRIFNPTLQGERFDPDGVYVRRWVPELAAVPIRWERYAWALGTTLIHEHILFDLSVYHEQRFGPHVRW
jgi:deoxyribodipyrimidine photolyase